MFSVRDRLEEGTGFSRLQRLALHSRKFAEAKYTIIQENGFPVVSTQGRAVIQVRERISKNLGNFEGRRCALERFWSGGKCRR